MLAALLARLQAVALRNNKFSGSAEMFGNCSLTSLDLAVSASNTLNHKFTAGVLRGRQRR